MQLDLIFPKNLLAKLMLIYGKLLLMLILMVFLILSKLGYHTLENNSRSRAMTLHIYANPINQCNVYNEEKSEFEIKEMAYDTVHKLDLSTAYKK